jgi:hypothetical protein
MKQRLLPQVDEDELPRKHKKQVGKLQTFAEGLLEEIYAFEDRVGRLNEEVAILKGEKKTAHLQAEQHERRSGTGCAGD